MIGDVLIKELGGTIYALIKKLVAYVSFQLLFMEDAKQNSEKEEQNPGSAISLFEPLRPARLAYHVHI